MAIIDDTNPQLGGNLDLNNFNILGTGSVNVIGSGNYSQGLYVNSTGVSLTNHAHTGLIKSDISITSGASVVNNIVVISEASYTALSVKDSNTIYFVT